MTELLKIVCTNSEDHRMKKISTVYERKRVVTRVVPYLVWAEPLFKRLFINYPFALAKTTLNKLETR